jgi:hypothetical protein
MLIYWTETYWLQKNNETFLVVSEKSGHEGNVDKQERVFMSCEENVEECNNISSHFLCGHNTKKLKLHSHINWGQIKLNGNLVPFIQYLFFCQIPIQKHRD